MGVGGSKALELQFDLTTGATVNAGMRYMLPAANNTSSNRAKYTVSFDLKLVQGVTAGMATPQFEIFTNPDTQSSASGFNITEWNTLVAGGNYVHFSRTLDQGALVFGHTNLLDPTVSAFDAAFVFLGFPANVTQVDQTYLIDNLKMEISAPPVVPLTLVVNKNTEQVSIKNNSANPVSFDYYDITSNGGALKPSGWNSLDDQNIGGLRTDFNRNGTVDAADVAAFKASFGLNAGADADADGDSDGADFLALQQAFGKVAGSGDSWIEAGGSNNNQLSELFLNGSTTLAPGGSVSLGAAYDKTIFGANNGDLVFNVSTGDSAALGVGTVSYVTVATATGTGVPEPTSLVLCLAALGMLGWKRR